MTRQTSGKRGLRSDTLKREASRHPAGPMPATTPVPGAFGKQAHGARAERSRASGAPGAAAGGKNPPKPPESGTAS
jgi:hypothetical protein